MLFNLLRWIFPQRMHTINSWGEIISVDSSKRFDNFRLANLVKQEQQNLSNGVRAIVQASSSCCRKQRYNEQPKALRAEVEF